MRTMKAAVVNKPGDDFEIITKEIPEPHRGYVRIRVEACGICHSDQIVKEGVLPGIPYPRIPGHEVAGVIDKIGEGVTSWQVGQRVGVGWHGGQCFHCDSCRAGDFINCDNRLICGISYDGGYAEYMVAPQEAVALIPDELSTVDAAPLLCAGLTTFNALRNSGARPGDVVAIQGVGGLGHMALQYANKFGYKTVALSRGEDKRELAHQLGAHVYIDTATTDAGAELKKLGGARVILATAPNGKAMSSLVNGLARNGKMFIIAATQDPIVLSSGQMLMDQIAVQGWLTGHAKDAEDTLNFSALFNTMPMTEVYPLEEVNQAYNRMIEGDARFRVVLKM
ncbi:alcohol dehydrogenase [Paenibacillus sp. R14(2021)]|uniref:alcohol dehydrogenase n=1 Tax=Paenibacillus sp. R14(2021) TaxID=2859228 RepID=UPI001C61268E|nr:alcohol dehydrogenase [Paenibacillus sp. R14(2021)]